MRRWLILFVAITAVVVTWWRVTAGPAPADVRTSIAEYSFSADPDEVVITINSRGGLARNELRYTLFGDGRLHRDRESTGSIATTELSYLEMDELVGLAARGGLIGLDWKTLEAEILKKHSGVRSLTDTPRLTLEFFLTAAQNANGEKLGAIASRFSCVCVPAYLAEYYDDIPEVRALDTLLKGFDARFERPKGDK